MQGKAKMAAKGASANFGRSATIDPASEPKKTAKILRNHVLPSSFHWSCCNSDKKYQWIRTHKGTINKQKLGNQYICGIFGWRRESHTNPVATPPNKRIFLRAMVCGRAQTIKSIESANKVNPPKKFWKVKEWLIRKNCIFRKSTNFLLTEIRGA